MKNEGKKETKFDIKKAWKVLRSEEGKKYSFFIFYFFFFIFIFILITSTRNISPKSKEEYSLPFKTNLIENKNYNFKYIVKTNYNDILYSGKKIDNEIKVIGDEGEYLYKYNNGNLNNLKNEKILLDELFDIFLVKRVIKNSKLISETRLTDENIYIYNYKIKSNYFSNLLQSNITNNLDNDVIIKTDNKRNIKNIELDLLNYEKELNRELTTFKISIEYEVSDE